MTIYLRQSTASQEVLLGPFVDDTDGKTAETALSIANTDIKIWKNGGTSEASKNSGGATHIASGRYYAVLDATDTNTLGPMEINVHVSGALPVRRECCVLAANIYDSLIGGGDLLDVSVTQWTGTNVASPDTAGYPKVTLKSGTGTGEVSLSSGTVQQTPIRQATAQAGASGSITLDASASATDNLYNGLMVQILSGTGAGQVRTITAYVGSTKVASTHPNWTTNPDSSSVFAILPNASTNVATWRGSTPNQLQSGRVDGYVGAMAADTVTASAVASDAGTEIGTAVWATAARTLTANTNLNDLNAAGIRAAVGLSSADLDTQLSGLATASALSTVSGYIDTEVAAIKAVTDLLPDGGALSSLASALATVDTNVDTLLTNIGTPIGTTIADQLSDSYTAIQQVANVTDMLVHTSGKLWVLDDNGNPLPNASDVAAIKAVTDKLDDTLEDDGGTYRFTTNALEQAPSGGGGGGLDAAGVRAAIGLASANLDTQLSGINTNIDGVETKIDTIDGVADAIKAKTDNLPSDPADQSLIMAAIDDLPTNAELATALGTADDAVLSAVATIDTAVGGIALKVADLWALDGLDISNPMTVTPTSRTTGTIAQTISGDGTTTSTVTRTA